jgi:hypothetical protein
MPLVHPGIPIESGNNSLGFSVFMTPKYLQAITDLIHFYRWKSIFYIYDSDDGMYCCDHVLLRGKLFFSNRRFLRCGFSSQKENIIC